MKGRDTMEGYELTVTEAAVNRTKGHMIGEVTQRADKTVYSQCRSMADVYRIAREYAGPEPDMRAGRCVGKVYVDTEDGAEHVGYVFQRRARYQDTGETYLHETWVTVEAVKTEVSRRPVFTEYAEVEA